MAKENRKNLRLWAEGARETVLQPHIEPYADALERGWRAERDYFQQVCKEFHARISWRLLDHEEPATPLPAFDSTAKLPPLENISVEETARRLARMDELDARIRRWLKYRVKRLRRHVRTRVDSTKDPWAILLAKLSGVNAPPKARQAYQQLMREAYAEVIDPVVKARWAETPAAGSSVQTAKEPNAPFRAKIAREVFLALPDADQAGYAACAKAEAEGARRDYEKALKDTASKTPADRHKCIENIGSFVAPILQGIHERTGLHSVLILGGPMPKYGGDLRTIHISYGRNRSAVGAHFPQWAKERFNGVLGLMKEYLETVFTKEDSEEAALPAGLDGAKFTISPASDDDDSSTDSNASDSDSGSDGETSGVKKHGKAAARKKKKKQRGGADAPVVDPTDTGSKAKGGGDAAQKKVPVKRKRDNAEETPGGERKKKRGPEEKTPVKRKRGGGEDIPDTSPARKSRRLAEAEATAAATEAEATAAAAAVATPPILDPQPVPTTSVVVTDTTPPTSTGGAAGEPAPVALAIAAASAPKLTLPAPTKLPTPPPTQVRGTAPAPPTLGTGPTPSATASAFFGRAAVAEPPLVPAAATTTTVPPAPLLTITTPPPPPPPTPPPAPPPAPPLFEFPTDCAPWLLNTIRVLSAVDLGCHFRALLETLIRVETKFGWEVNPREGVSKVSRPVEVGAWIRAARGTKSKGPYDANITNIAGYSERWRTWWDSLQPEWRKRTADGEWEIGGTHGEDFESLWFPGQNGCLCVVASLYFWGTARSAMGHGGGSAWDAGNREKWERAVQDVMWMMEGLESALPAPKGRKGRK
ncbi:hypothetical protein DFH09DRAFT_1317346 [Mycena vulgaris]|nr:hypothetical protein DFH09DRAFT_1317346 [Mycena vulgaris]